MTRQKPTTTVFSIDEVWCSRAIILNALDGFGKRFSEDEVTVSDDEIAYGIWSIRPRDLFFNYDFWNSSAIPYAHVWISNHVYLICGIIPLIFSFLQITPEFSCLKVSSKLDASCGR